MQRKEKLLKKQHRQALMLDNMIGMDGIAAGRSLRDRKPVTYTFGMCHIALIIDFFPCLYLDFSSLLSSILGVPLYSKLNGP